MIPEIIDEVLTMNILEFIDYCMEELGMTEDQASRLADLEFNSDYEED